MCPVRTERTPLGTSASAAHAILALAAQRSAMDMESAVTRGKWFSDLLIVAGAIRPCS